MAESDDLYQIALLIDQLKHDDTQLRVAASKSLCRIAKTLGPDRTRDELIPFLSESADDEDEVLLSVSEMLGELVEYVGGKDFAYTLLEPLKLMAAVEDTKVRDKAITSIQRVVNNMSTDHLKTHYLPFVTDLARKEWFTSRTSAVYLCCIGYEKHSKDSKDSINAIYLQLCNDDTPTVRRTSAQQFHTLIDKINTTELSKEFLSALESLMNDDQDSVRIHAVNSCVQLSKVLSISAFTTQILPLINSVVNDNSWRLKWALASCLHIVFASFNNDKSLIDKLLLLYSDLLSDNEAEVRAAALATLDLVTKHLSRDRITKTIFPLLQSIANDNSEMVRASLANVLNNVSEDLGKDNTIEHLLPILLLFLRDESSEVRLNIISKLDKLSQVIGVQLLSQSLIPAISELATHTKWRIRISLIDNIPMLLKHLGQNFYETKLNDIYIEWLKDHVHAVRKAAADKLSYFVDIFGVEWTIKYIIPQIENLRNDSNFCHRNTSILCYRTLMLCMKENFVEKYIIPSLLLSMKDSVPNIRINCIKTIDMYLSPTSSLSTHLTSHQKNGSATNSPRRSPPVLDAVILGKIITQLDAMMSDKDRDVQFYAKQSCIIMYGFMEGKMLSIL